jgi:apolipoprotein N-acyltransferase
MQTKPKLLGVRALAFGLIHVWIAVAAFHAAFRWDWAASLIGVYLYCLWQLSQLATGRQAFYAGFGVGMACFAPQLFFFWEIFGPAAIALWAVLAFWIGAFTWLACQCRRRYGGWLAVAWAPVVWCGLEYFRSELYYLRFSWLAVGYAFSGPANVGLLKLTGVYGAGFALMLVAAMIGQVPGAMRAVIGTALVVALQCSLPFLLPGRIAAPGAMVRVAGIQAEFPAAFEVPLLLDLLERQQPKAKLLLMSEYTLDGPVPASVRDWCRRHQKHILIGGKQHLDAAHYYNTVFVVGPSGKTVFRQAKSVPIQFFRDGLPAPFQTVWHSPWGRLGICVCYDLSYVRVVDELVCLGARLILVPTMDVSWWGAYEHALHARVARVRAAELQTPIFRLASSGISQLVAAAGNTVAEAPNPGEKATLGGVVEMSQAANVPRDRRVASGSVCAVLILMLAHLFARVSWAFRPLLRNALDFHITFQPITRT